jgi:hypothetical protein
MVTVMVSVCLSVCLSHLGSKPAKHTHSCTRSAPILRVVMSGGHGTHPPVAPLLYSPTGQSPTPPWTGETGKRTHSLLEAAPIWTVVRPGGHGMQRSRPPRPYVPSLHSTQAPPGDFSVPGGHPLTHVWIPTFCPPLSVVVPSGHSSHSDRASGL